MSDDDIAEDKSSASFEPVDHRACDVCAGSYWLPRMDGNLIRQNFLAIITRVATVLLSLPLTPWTWTWRLPFIWFHSDLAHWQSTSYLPHRLLVAQMRCKRNYW